MPVPLQKAVWAAYVPGQEISKTPSPEYIAAAKAAIRAVEIALHPSGKAAIEERVENCVLLRPEDGTVATPLFRVLAMKDEDKT